MKQSSSVKIVLKIGFICLSSGIVWFSATWIWKLILTPVFAFILSLALFRSADIDNPDTSLFFKRAERAAILGYIFTFLALALLAFSEISHVDDKDEALIALIPSASVAGGIIGFAIGPFLHKIHMGNPGKAALKLLLNVALRVGGKLYAFISSLVLSLVLYSTNSLKNILESVQQAGSHKTLVMIAAVIGFLLAQLISFGVVLVVMSAPYGAPGGFPGWLKVLIFDVFLATLATPAIYLISGKREKRIMWIRAFTISYLITLYPLYGIALFLAVTMIF